MIKTKRLKLILKKIIFNDINVYFRFKVSLMFISVKYFL